MADGKVITGYSFPYVAVYNANEGNPTYSGGMPLARGVEVSTSLESGDDNNFYANNVLAESGGSVFTGGTVTLTIDGLKKEARALISGTPATDTITVGQRSVSVTHYDDRQVAPYVGIGFVIRYMEDGVTTYAPCVLRKCKFNNDDIQAVTQSESIEFQTSELNANIFRDDSTYHEWKTLPDDQETEEQAVEVLRTILNIV